jgi:sulfatase maturation enzyme AslB (radical SAM superfamily)
MNKSFCALPWLHIHTFPSGKVFPCCVADKKLPIGNLNDNTIDEIIHSSAMNDIRAKMLKGENVENCMQSCTAHENTKNTSNNFSKRNTINKFYEKIIPDLIELTNEDGSFKNKDDFQMKHLNIRFSNLCNFKCRSCYSELSSLILQEEDPTKKTFHIKDVSPTIIDDVYKYLPNVDLIHFAGGETLLIDEHWEIMDKLIELGNTNVSIVCTTNLSKITYKNKNIIDYVKQFKDFTLYVSIDAIKERAELYRSGTIWETIENNLKILVDSGIKFTITSTVGATNIYHIPDVLDYLITNNLIYQDRLIFNILTAPLYLNCRILPADYKKIVTEKIDKYIETQPKFNKRFSELKNFMNSEDQIHLIPDFVAYHNKKDMHRNQSTVSVFPELASIFS